MSSVVALPDGGKIVKTNCFECHAKCGVLCEVDKDGVLVGVKGNPDDPRSEGRMCGKGLSAPKILYDPDRLRYPLRRLGARGAGEWEQITWDEAIEWLAQRVEELTAEYGAETIAYGQGTGRGTNQWTGRAGNAGGRVHHSLSPGNICLVPMMVQAFLQFGMFPTFDGCDFDHADCIVFWGANSVWTEPTYTSGQVGRSPDTIRASARTYATAPAATINVFQGLEEQTNCKDILQLVNCIIAICGNLEKRGGNLSMPFWNQMGPLTGAEPETQKELRIVDERAAGTVYGISNPTCLFKAMRTGEPYPVKGYIMVQGNPLSWAENTALVKESLMQLDLLVCMDYYLSPTCELADLVLPSTHWTERDYLADEVCSEWVFGQQKAVEPLYERKSDVWFWRTFGHRLSPEWWPWESDEELFDWQLEQTHAGVTWDELKEKWIHHVPMMPSRDFEENGFGTPTGRAELYSVIELVSGSKPFPEAAEPKESVYATPDIAKEYPLTGVTGRRYPIYYHSAFRGIPHLREIVPEPQVVFHTSLAEELGIERDEWVWIESPTGRITMKARPSDGIDPRVCVIPHGWWQACPALGLPGYPDGSSNANTLTSDRAYNDEFLTPGLRSTLCRIVKKKEGE